MSVVSDELSTLEEHVGYIVREQDQRADSAIRWCERETEKYEPNKVYSPTGGKEEDGDDVVDHELPKVGSAYVKRGGDEQRVVEAGFNHIVPPRIVNTLNSLCSIFRLYPIILRTS